VIALISPHAGHMFSGPVAGYAFAAIKDLQPEQVVILSPYHAYHSGAILTSGHQAYQTPLGLVPIASDSINWIEDVLKERTGIELIRVRNDEEHAVEILLPFLQQVIETEFKLVPLMIRDQDPDLMKALGLILSSLTGQGKVLLVASTDLSHFFPAEKAQELDQTIIDQISTLDPEGLYRVQNDGQGSACGLGAMAALLWAVQDLGPVKHWHLNYAHSGQITGDNNRVVGYTSEVITLT
jgi:AmmeMemoRadiSam system protein B